MAKLKPEFEKRGVKILALSVDPVDKHSTWAKDIEETQGHAPNYPIVGDPSLEISKLYEMLPAGAGNTADGRTAADNQTVRTVYVVGPDKKTTPVNWRQGDEVIIAGSVTNDEAKKIYPDGWKEPKPYIRIVPQPGAPSTGAST